MAATALPIESAAPEEAVQVMEHLAENLSLSTVLYSVLLFLACLLVMKVVMTLTDRAMTRLKVEPTVHKFTRSCLKVLMWLVTVMVVAAYLGLPINSLVAILGIVGVALSLSLQGSLSNLAGGITVMATRPFAVGDYVEAGGVSGTVAEIGLVYTKLKTVDNKVIFVPNGEISTEKIINYNSQDKRRVDLTFSVSYDADPEQAKAIMREVVGAHPKALFTPAPFVRTTALGESSVNYTLRVWCAAEDYWGLYYDLLEQVRAAFDRAGIEFTYNHLNIHVIPPEKG